MVHTCSVFTDLDEIIGTERREGQGYLFEYGPLPLAMKAGEELVLENSGILSACMLRKVSLILGNLYIDETAEVIEPREGFRLTFH